MVGDIAARVEGDHRAVVQRHPHLDEVGVAGHAVLVIGKIDGHDVAQIHHAIKFASETQGKPTAIICSTIKGKGVSVFENQVRFHGGQPTEEEWKVAFEEIDTRISELEE